ncbi:unnamed protein product [Strongylus vulgaris]|uniref:Uncharacterized protein n=1 Tax=Strongylus vulgaris TaxID=40348 RepID=A0A3P7KVZ4_STRVU|nr:unnamed protein product [Strongylus vulgaris]
MECCAIAHITFRRQEKAVGEKEKARLVVKFEYAVYDWIEHRWSQRPSLHETVRIPLIGGVSRVELLSSRRHRLRISLASNRPFREVQPGMYYVESGNGHSMIT